MPPATPAVAWTASRNTFPRRVAGRDRPGNGFHEMLSTMMSISTAWVRRVP
jgi:hypothetical protein